MNGNAVDCQVDFGFSWDLSKAPERCGKSKVTATARVLSHRCYGAMVLLKAFLIVLLQGYSIDFPQG